MNKILFLFIILLSPFIKAQQTEFVDFKKAKVDIIINPFEKTVSGTVVYNFEVLKNIDSIFIDAQKMKFLSVKLDGKKVKFNNSDSKLWITKKLKSKSNHILTINYNTSPKKAMYFIGWEYNNINVNSGVVKKQVWTQGQGKYTSNWVPSFDDTNEKVEFDLNITFNEDYEVIANGKLIDVEKNEGLKTWHYDMQQPMSSYLLAVAIGKYNKKIEYSKSGIPIEMYYYPEDSLKFEPTYRYTKQVFDFFEEEIGVSYPWQNYKQIPVKDFMYAGMENTSATIFSDTYVIDSISFIDKNYVNVNAHELAHQWFGDLVTAKSGEHHWLQEGFATYYALLAEKEVFGNDYFYWKLYKSGEQLLKLSEEGKGESVINPNASSLTFYEKGAWVLYMLKEKVGDKAFKDGVKNYLLNHQFKNVETDDFISEVEKSSQQDLSSFVEAMLISDMNLWLNDYTQLLKFRKLYNDSGIDYMDCLVGEDLEKFKKEQNIKKLKLLSDTIFYGIKYEFVKDILKDSTLTKKEIYQTILKSNDIKVRQLISESLDSIPLELKQDFELLLDDKSYATIENALYKLWLNFPKQRITYLNETKGIIGFNDKNVRMLWLALALATPGYENEHKQAYFYELSDYTLPIQHFEVRQNAFEYLYQLLAFSEQNLKDLVNACQHHSWRFAKFSRDLLDELLKEENFRKRFVDLISGLNDDEAKYLSKKLETK